MGYIIGKAIGNIFITLILTRGIIKVSGKKSILINLSADIFVIIILFFVGWLNEDISEEFPYWIYPSISLILLIAYDLFTFYNIFKKALGYLLLIFFGLIFIFIIATFFDSGSADAFGLFIAFLGLIVSLFFIWLGGKLIGKNVFFFIEKNEKSRIRKEIEDLDILLQNKLITKDEFEARKKKILDI